MGPPVIHRFPWVVVGSDPFQFYRTADLIITQAFRWMLVRSDISITILVGYWVVVEVVFNDLTNLEPFSSSMSSTCVLPSQGVVVP